MYDGEPAERFQAFTQCMHICETKDMATRSRPRCVHMTTWTLRTTASSQQKRLSEGPLCLDLRRLAQSEVPQHPQPGRLALRRHASAPWLGAVFPKDTLGVNVVIVTIIQPQARANMQDVVVRRDKPPCKEPKVACMLFLMTCFQPPADDCLDNRRSSNAWNPRGQSTPTTALTKPAPPKAPPV